MSIREAAKRFGIHRKTVKKMLGFSIPPGYQRSQPIRYPKLEDFKGIIDELGFVPLSKTGAELLFEVFSQRYERGSILVTSNLPFDEWTEVFGSERLTGALLDRLTHHVHILEMNGESYRLNQSKKQQKQLNETSSNQNDSN
jgi:hypothetical protein